MPIAIAGTREPTYGVDLTREVVKALIDEVFSPIVTGGARGIDTIALDAAVDYGEVGVKVLPCVLDEDVNPMIEKISEHLCGSGWQPRLSGWFVTRNRITVGMSYALIVTEARVSNPRWRRYGVACCGTQHAVEYAIQYKRPVYIITPPQDILKSRILYGAERIEQAYRLIVEAGAVPVKTVQELIKELKQVVKR
jgi:DNA processing protein